MKQHQFNRSVWFVAALAACLAGAWWRASSPVAAQTTRPAALQGEAALAQLKKDGQYDSLQAAMQQARYTVRRAERTPLHRAAWHAPNPAAGYDAYVTEDGVSIAVDENSYVSLTLRGIGYGDGLQYVGGGAVSGDKQRLAIARDGAVREWYVNGAGGLEQGFSLREPPNGIKQPGLKLRLALQVNDGWRAVASADGQRVTLRGQAANEVVEYGKLAVWDAHGSPVTAALAVKDERVIIEVEDSQATYPLTIDPVFALQQTLTAADGKANDAFGRSVALSGETAVVGADKDDVGLDADQGSAYVFVRTGATWTQQAHLIASDGAAGDRFGISVALSGETVVVGAYLDDVGANNNQGSAYVFTRGVLSWAQQAQLTAADGAAGDGFGISVALGDDTAVVGAYQDDVGSSPNRGSAYVFVHHRAVWEQQARLLANFGAANDYFGYSVAISGNTVLAGAYADDAGASTDQGSAYVFVRNGTTWTQQAQLLAADGAAGDYFGISVALSGDTALVGASNNDVGANANQGAAYVFTRSGTSWSQQAQLTAADGRPSDNFGVSVALSGTTAVVGAYHNDVGLNADQGAVYVFKRSGAAWSRNAQLTALDGAANDLFGISVAVSGETVAVGASGADVAGHAGQGSVAIYTQPGAPLIPQAQLLAADGAEFDQFGNSVALSGDTAVVGAYVDDVGADAEQGSAYIFVRNGTTWTEQAHLTAPYGSANDWFGWSVAISGETVVIGAPFDDVSSKPNRGSAHIFVRSGAAWTQQQILFAPDGEVGDAFGYSVALSGETALVGAFHDDIATNSDQGSAHVFMRSGTTWTHQQQLTATSGGAGEQFGFSVALDGETALVGANLEWVAGSVSYEANQGAAYVFTRNGASWTQQARLTAADGASGDQFGFSVALSDDTAVIGASMDNVGTQSDQGSAYVFERIGTTWYQRKQLTAEDGAAGDNFGQSVAISGSIIVVGAISDDVGANVNQGSAYVFTHNGSFWTQQAQLTAPDGAANDAFGSSVAINGATVVAGAFLDDAGAFNQGSAYVFVPCLYELTPAFQWFPAAGGGGSFNLTCDGSCNWTATALPDWITLTGSASGSGDATITFTVAPNPGPSRSGSISVKGSSFVVTQAGN
jgi:hypothetical protein